MNFRCHALILCGGLCLIPGARSLAAPQASSGLPAQARADLQSAADNLEALQLFEARELIESVGRSHPNAAPLLFQRSMLHFYQGRYEQAAALSIRALRAAPKSSDWARWTMYNALQQATHEVTENFEVALSQDGRYAVFYSPGKDALLAPYALEVLAAIDRALEQKLGVSPPSPIRLEIYPSAESLAKVSSLTVEQIHTTGTVALSKWNRLMITTPRALVRGYPWADTIAHEYVHLVVSRATHERAPVWLQEGIAKLLERSWRETDSELKLDPPSLALLADALEGDGLLSFEQMHPSIALLPSQGDAALAFAQVATFMERFTRRHGEAGLRHALRQIRDGVDAREALAVAAGVSFSQLERQWKAALPRGTAGKAPRQLRLRFRRGSGDQDEAQDVAAVEARRFMRLGDLLWDRGRVGAAKTEYDKALREDPDDPIVAARLARAALESGDPGRAVSALEPLVERYPGHAPTHAVLGAARLALGKRDSARVALVEAIRINPFDPQPHCDLSQLLETAESIERERQMCVALRR